MGKILYKIIDLTNSSRKKKGKYDKIDEIEEENYGMLLQTLF